MNQRLEGWRLALAVLLPALILALAIWFLLQAFGGEDDQAVDTVPVATPTPVPTVPVQTQVVSDPTPVPSPTPLQLPTAAPLPAATVAPTAEATAVPTTAPVQTAPSQPVASQPAGPTATPTVDPNLLTITCGGGSFPISIAPGETVSGLSAQVSPAGAESGLQFLWNFGNGRLAGAPNSGTVTYDTAGTYTVTLEATDTVTIEVTTVTCGTVNVGTTSGGNSGPAELSVSCRVRPNDSSIEWRDATTDDIMRTRVSWTPKATELNLRYEFPNPNEPLVFANGVTSPDTLPFTFVSLTAKMRIVWEDPASGDRGVVECPVFSDEVLTYNIAGNP